MAFEFFGNRFGVHVPNSDKLVFAASCYEVESWVEARVVDEFGHPVTGEIVE